MATAPLLVLDLDETLVSSISSPTDADLAQAALPYTLLEVEFDGHRVRYAVFARPFLESFLRYVARFYRLALWSAGVAPYVHAVYDAVLRPLAAFEFVRSANHCDRADTYKIVGSAAVSPSQTVKNLASIGERSLRRVLLVDNQRGNAMLQPRNHVGLPDFVANAPGAWRDNWLPELAEFLEQLAAVRDVRHVDKAWWTIGTTGAPLPLTRMYLSVTALRDWRLRRQHERKRLLWTMKAPER